MRKYYRRNKKTKPNIKSVEQKYSIKFKRNVNRKMYLISCHGVCNIAKSLEKILWVFTASWKLVFVIRNINFPFNPLI